MLSYTVFFGDSINSYGGTDKVKFQSKEEAEKYYMSNSNATSLCITEGEQTIKVIASRKLILG